MQIDKDKIDDAILALLYLTSTTMAARQRVRCLEDLMGRNSVILWAIARKAGS